MTSLTNQVGGIFILNIDVEMNQSMAMRPDCDSLSEKELIRELAEQEEEEEFPEPQLVFDNEDDQSLDLVFQPPPPFGWLADQPLDGWLDQDDADQPPGALVREENLLFASLLLLVSELLKLNCP